MPTEILTARDDGHEWSVRTAGHRKVAVLTGKDAERYARLFAAAPVMLEALQRLAKVDLLWAWNDADTLAANMNRMRKQIAAVAEAALAQTEAK